MENKKIILLIVIVGILIGGVTLLFNLFNRLPKEDISTVKKEVVQVITKEEALSLFPVYFPVEIRAPNSVESQISYSKGKKVVTYNYFSNKDIIDVSKSFNDFFVKNKWKATSTQSTASLKVLIATDQKAKDSVIVTINTNETSKGVNVSILYSQDLYAKLDKKILLDFPNEKGINVSTNDAEVNDVKYGKTLIRTYTSNLSMEDNYKIYQDFALQNLWHIWSDNATPNISKGFIASKASSTLEVLVITNPSKGGKFDISIRVYNSK